MNRPRLVFRVRIGSFGLATVLGLFFGLYVRINNPLAQSPAEQLEKWHAVFPVTVSDGKPETEANHADSPEQAGDNRILARQMMIYERTGLVPSKLRFRQGSSSGKGKKDPETDSSGKVTVAESKYAGTRTIESGTF